MAAKVERTFSGTLSQSVVVCMLALFVVLSVVAMFTTVAVSDEIVWIGMTAKPLNAEAAAALGISGYAGGVIVGEVDGIAQRAGIRHGDVLLGINGHPVQDLVDLARLAGETDISRGGAQLDIIRQGARIPVFVLPPGELVQLPGPTVPQGAARALAAIDRGWLGIDAETFTAGEGGALGIPAGVGGVLIDGVARGGLAERVGLAVNDVIVSLNGQRIDAAADLWNTLAGLNAGVGVELGVYRGGRLLSIALSAVSGTLVGGFPGRMGGGGLGPGGFVFCPNGSGTFVGGFPAARGAGPSAAPAWGAGRGRMGGWGLGPGGLLVCPSCGTRVAHQRGVPGFTVPCPSCGTVMMRAQ